MSPSPSPSRVPTLPVSPSPLPPPLPTLPSVPLSPSTLPAGPCRRQLRVVGGEHCESSAEARGCRRHRHRHGYLPVSPSPLPPPLPTLPSVPLSPSTLPAGPCRRQRHRPCCLAGVTVLAVNVNVLAGAVTVVNGVTVLAVNVNVLAGAVTVVNGALSPSPTLPSLLLPSALRPLPSLHWCPSWVPATIRGQLVSIWRQLLMRFHGCDLM